MLGLRVSVLLNLGLIYIAQAIVFKGMQGSAPRTAFFWEMLLLFATILQGE